jgi:hypothetical protein
METLIINIPNNKSALVKQLLIELGVKIHNKPDKKKAGKTPNAITLKTIERAHKGKGIGEPIKDIKSFINSL